MSEDNDDEDADDEDRIETINIINRFLLKLLKDVFIFPDNEFVISFIFLLENFSFNF